MDDAIAKSSIRKAVGGVLEELGLTDDFLKQANLSQLQVEGRIATEVYGYFMRLADGERPSLVEGDMLDQFEREHADIKYRAELVERVSRALKLNVKTGGNWDPVLKFIERMERKKGQRIETYADWCTEDPYNSPKAHQIANKPSLIEATWPQAFPEGVQMKLEQAADGGYDF